MRWMKLEPIIQSEVSHKEKEILYINTYICNSERQYQWSYMQSSIRDTDIKNRPLYSVREVNGGMIWENSIETYVLPCVKQITSASLMYDAGHPKPVLCDNLEG